MGLKADSVQSFDIPGRGVIGDQPGGCRARRTRQRGWPGRKVGFRVDQARAQYLLGNALATTGKPSEAIPHYRRRSIYWSPSARKTAPGACLERSDLKDIYRDAAERLSRLLREEFRESLCE